MKRLKLEMLQRNSGDMTILEKSSLNKWRGNKMKKISACLILFVLLLLPLQLKAADRYEIDPSHSTLIFKVKHLNTSYFYGRFNDITGSIVADAKNPANSSVITTVKTESIDTNDEKRDKHLRNPDFFNASQFPEIRFRSEKIEQLRDGTYMVSGKLLLHGIEKSLQVKMTKTGEGKDPWGNYRMGLHTSFKIKRSDFGMKYMLDGIGDEVELSLGIEAIRKES